MGRKYTLYLTVQKGVPPRLCSFVKPLAHNGTLERDRQHTYKPRRVAVSLDLARLACSLLLLLNHLSGTLSLLGGVEDLHSTTKTMGNMGNFAKVCSLCLSVCAKTAVLQHNGDKKGILK